MKLSWIFGSSMEAHHLLAAYVAVWLVQGGYAGWIAWQWVRAGKDCNRTSRSIPARMKSSENLFRNSCEFHKHRPQRLKPQCKCSIYGTAKAVPLSKTRAILSAEVSY